MLGYERCDLRLSDNAVVESDGLRVGVGDVGGNAVQSAVFERLDQASDRNVSHSHLPEEAGWRANVTAEGQRVRWL